MKSMFQKIEQVEGLIDTKDVNEVTNKFLKDVRDGCARRKGDTTWLSSSQIAWLERIHEKHFA